MSTAQYQSPLLFLTTTDASLPTGRNARKRARSEAIAQTKPSESATGFFSSFAFQVDAGCGRPANELRTTSRRARIKHTRHVRANHPRRVDGPESTPLASTLVKRLRMEVWPPTARCEELNTVLEIATFHIRRRAAQLVYCRPESIVDALRCRQWCSGSSILLTRHKNPYLDSAIACVVSGVRTVISGSSDSTDMLVCYASALRQLRLAISDATTHERADLFAAMQLLAIYEMLDFPDSVSWMQHTAGALAMARTQDFQMLNGDYAIGHILPIFVEALISGEKVLSQSHAWPQLVELCVAWSFPNQESVPQMVRCLHQLQVVLTEAFAMQMANMCVDSSARVSLLIRAHDLRNRLKKLVQLSEAHFFDGPKRANACDILGVFLVGIMSLDKLIETLRPAGADQSLDLEQDTHELCLHMLGLELHMLEGRSGKDLLHTFSQQMNANTSSSVMS